MRFGTKSRRLPHLSTQILLLQLGIIALTVGVASAFAYLHAKDDLAKRAGAESLAIAQTVATNQRIVHALSGAGGAKIIDPASFPKRQEYIDELFRLRHRKGITSKEAIEQIDNVTLLGSMMVRLGDADAMISGLNMNYPDTIRPALQVLKVREGMHKVAGAYVLGRSAGGSSRRVIGSPRTTILR